ncbi:hypothetical protein [Variovorax sp. UC122_21]|uniref:hypothetical protein n=1 Tax=Variovorax TaxID=34072 RepID=UPI0019317FC6|nr:hypothetical protein INQ48_33955 [Variovorax paradoxus]
MQSRQKIHHGATVTLVLPGGMSTQEEVAALRAAGVPVDDRGEVTVGFLFLRWQRATNRMVFRWFARTPGEGAMPAPPQSTGAASSPPPPFSASSGKP